MSVSILLIDAHHQRGDALAKALTESGYETVVQATSYANLTQTVMAAHPDVVMLDLENPTAELMDELRTLNQRHPKPVVLFTRDQKKNTIHDAIASGVSAYVVDGIGRCAIDPIIETAVARFKHIRQLEKQLHLAQTNLNDRKTIDRAKGILMAQKKITEETAYKLLQKMAMDRKKKMAEIAVDVIELANLFTEPASIEKANEA